MQSAASDSLCATLAGVKQLCEKHKLPYRITGHYEAVCDMNKVLLHASTLPDGFPWLAHQIHEHFDCMAE